MTKAQKQKFYQVFSAKIDEAIQEFSDSGHVDWYWPEDGIGLMVESCALIADACREHELWLIKERKLER